MERYLSHRANINTKITNQGDVVIYEDHRTILNVLYHQKIEGKLATPVDIYMFDYHDDGCHPKETILPIIDRFQENAPSLEEFWNFVEFNLGALDDDWVKTGMELGLINNCFLFNCQDSRIDFIEEYDTRHYGQKKTYNIGYVWDELYDRGSLHDIVKADEFQQLWDDIGWVYDKENHRFQFQPTNNFIVDFDLDCFTTEILGKPVAIPEEILLPKFQELQRPTYHYYHSPERFIQELLQRADLITMCYEANFCGGIRECMKIFNTIDDLFFEGDLVVEFRRNPNANKIH